MLGSCDYKDVRRNSILCKKLLRYDIYKLREGQGKEWHIAISTRLARERSSRSEFFCGEEAGRSPNDDGRFGVVADGGHLASGEGKIWVVWLALARWSFLNAML